MKMNFSHLLFKLSISFGSCKLYLQVFFKKLNFPLSKQVPFGSNILSKLDHEISDKKKQLPVVFDLITVNEQFLQTFGSPRLKTWQRTQSRLRAH